MTACGAAARTSARFTRDAPSQSVVYVVLVTLSMLVNGPGRLCPDSVYMLWQGQNLSGLNDWHSPFSTLVYSLFTPLFGSPNAALFVQSALMMALPAVWAPRLFCHDIGRPQRAVLTLVWLVLTTTMLALAGQIVKDVLGLCFLSFGLATVERARAQGRPRATSLTRLIAGLCLVGFVLQRPTSLLALLPALAVGIVLQGTRRQRWVSASRMALFVAAAILAVVITPPLLGAQKTHPENTPIVFDLAGISTVLHEDLFSPIFRSQEPRQAPWDCDTRRSSDNFFWGTCKEYQKLIDGRQGEIVAAWIPAIVHHPGAYLAHRAGFARELLMTYGSTSLLPAPPDFSSGVANVAPARPDDISAGLKIWHPTIAYAPFGRVAYFILCQTRASQGFIWIVALLLLPPIGWWFKIDRLAREGTALSAFGIANAVTMVFLGPAAEARYLLPTWWCLAVEIFIVASAPLFIRSPLEAAAGTKRFSDLDETD